jgi:hypothetical protein
MEAMEVREPATWESGRAGNTEEWQRVKNMKSKQKRIGQPGSENMSCCNLGKCRIGLAVTGIN